MKNRLGNILKRIVLAFGVIYGVDVLLNKVGVHIPINVFTVGITSLLGVPGLLSIFMIFYLIK